MYTNYITRIEIYIRAIFLIKKNLNKQLKLCNVIILITKLNRTQQNQRNRLFDAKRKKHKWCISLNKI
jgi:hypothetical protein